MPKDYIKMFEAIDKKRAKDEHENIKNLQNRGMYPQHFSFPITLQFELTGACNLKCKHCYNRSGDKDNINHTFMSAAKWKELSREVVNNGGIFQCIISGGEPLLLGEDLFEIMDILHDDGTSFVVITNGMLLNKNIAKKFTKYRFFWFQISIDGATEKIHDNFRGVNGSWKNAVNGAMEITNNGIPLVIAHSVTPDNLNQLEDMVKLAYSVGAGSIIIGEVLPSGRAFSNQELLLNKEQRNHLYMNVNELSQKYAGKIKIERSMNINSSMYRYTSQPNSGGIIRPNGDFRLDCMAPFTIGNVLEKSIASIWKEKGENAWHNPKVIEYVESINTDNQQGNILNHVSKDIRL